MSIHTDIGGAAAVSAAVDDFYRRVLADPELASYFASVGDSARGRRTHHRDDR